VVPRSWIIGLWVALCAITVFLIVVALKYLVVAPDQLPSFLPGSLHHTGGIVRYKVHYTNHPLRRNAVIALGLAGVSMYGAFRLGSRLLWG
jgi:hypothetical protein